MFIQWCVFADIILLCRGLSTCGLYMTPLTQVPGTIDYERISLFLFLHLPLSWPICVRSITLKRRRGLKMILFRLLYITGEPSVPSAAFLMNVKQRFSKLQMMGKWLIVEPIIHNSWIRWCLSRWSYTQPSIIILLLLLIPASLFETIMREFWKIETSSRNGWRLVISQLNATGSAMNPQSFNILNHIRSWKQTMPCTTNRSII